MATRSTPAAAATTPNYTGPFITVAALFFIFGFITNLNMALVPHLRNISLFRMRGPCWRSRRFSWLTLFSHPRLQS